MQGCSNPADSPPAAAVAPREAGAERGGAGKCALSGRSGTWGSAEMGAHVGGATVKALAAVPWPPGSGALRRFSLLMIMQSQICVINWSQVFIHVCTFA